LDGVSAAATVVVVHGAASVGIERIEISIVGPCAWRGSLVELLGWSEAVSFDKPTSWSTEDPNGGSQGKEERREGNHIESLGRELI
jgi:hypothetical protein